MNKDFLFNPLCHFQKPRVKRMCAPIAHIHLHCFSRCFQKSASVCKPRSIGRQPANGRCSAVSSICPLLSQFTRKVKLADKSVAGWRLPHQKSPKSFQTAEISKRKIVGELLPSLVKAHAQRAKGGQGGKVVKLFG